MRPEWGSVSCSYDSTCEHPTTNTLPRLLSSTSVLDGLIIRGILVTILSFASDRNPTKITLSKQANKQQTNRGGMEKWEKYGSEKDTDRDHRTEEIVAETK